MIRCIWCNGRGWLRHNVWAVPCKDCDGQGYHKFCLACHGRGALWLGGGDYVECPECQGSGGILKNRTHTNEGIVVVRRSPQLETKLASEG